MEHNAFGLNSDPDTGAVEYIVGNDPVYVTGGFKELPKHYIEFVTSELENGTVSYAVDEEDAITLEASANANTRISDIYKGSLVTISVEAGEGYRCDGIEAFEDSARNTRIADYEVQENDEIAFYINDEDIYIRVNLVAGDPDDPDDPVGPGDEIMKPYEFYHDGDSDYYRNKDNASVITKKVIINGIGDVLINDSDELGVLEGNSAESNLTFNYIEGSGTVDVYLKTLFIEKYTEIKVNGVSYKDQLPKTKEDYINAFYRQGTMVYIHDAVIDPESDTIEIEVTRTNAGDDVYVGNFLWFNTELMEEEDFPQGDIADDDKIDGGAIKLVRAVYGEETLFDEEEDINELVENTSKDWSGDSVIGSAVFPAGTELTIRLVPDYGKQLVSFGINGGAFDAEEDRATYTFEVESGNFHLAAFFDDVDDEADNSNPAISSVSYKNNGEDPESGTVLLSVMPEEDVDELSMDCVNLDGKTISNVMASFRLNLENVFYAGTNEINPDWSEELEESTTVTLGIKNYDSKITYELYVIDEDNNSSKKIASTVNKSKKTVSFTTNKYDGYVYELRAKCHLYGEWAITKYPSGKKQGQMTRTCQYCGKKEVKNYKTSDITLKVKLSTVTMKKGKSFAINSNLKTITKGDKVAKVVSSNTSVVAVDSKLNLKAKAEGTVKITVTMKSGKTGNFKIKVTTKDVATTKITGLEKTLSLKKKQKVTLSPVLEPFTSTDKITFKSSKPDVATVTSKGLVTAKKAGKTDITVKAGKISFKIAVTVK